jgi:hypothetical protein
MVMDLHVETYLSRFTVVHGWVIVATPYTQAGTGTVSEAKSHCNILRSVNDFGV